MGDSKDLSWQSAVAELTTKKERAVTAVGMIKRLGGPGDLTAAEIAYGDGRAETEAAIAALAIALEAGSGANDRADLDARIERATAARETLGRRPGPRRRHPRPGPRPARERPAALLSAPTLRGKHDLGLDLSTHPSP